MVRYTSVWIVLAYMIESFGVASFVLEMTPFTSLVMVYTNTVGAALWAADIEKAQCRPPTTAPRLREQAKKVE